MLRVKLDRLARRTKGCAKSVEMPVNLLAPVFCGSIKLNATHNYAYAPPDFNLLTFKPAV